MIYQFKRVGLVFALLAVELFLFMLFLLFYTKILWVSWNTSIALYWLIGILMLFVGTLVVFLKNKSKLNLLYQQVHFVEAVLLNKIQIGLFHRKLFIWTFEYTIGNKKVKKRYWHFVKVRDIEIGDHFMLAIDNMNDGLNYFPLKEDNVKS